MKKYYNLILFLLVLFLTGCQQTQAPKGNLVVDGSISIGVKNYGTPYFYGYVKNTGNNTVYNSEIAFTVYTDSTKNTIKATANGFPADLEDISPNVRAPFEAICFNLDTAESITIYDYKITWLDK